MDPITKIVQDREIARQHQDPNADLCFLALVDESNAPSLRTLVLRDIKENGFSIFINKTSPKWRLFQQGSQYELLLWYPSVQRQYRISGSHGELPGDEVKPKWRRRPLGSKFLDLLYQRYPQSSKIESRQTLLEGVQALRDSHDSDDPETPDNVGGIELIADRIEMLDLNQKDRIHDRRRFNWQEGSWEQQILIP